MGVWDQFQAQMGFAPSPAAPAAPAGLGAATAPAAAVGLNLPAPSLPSAPSMSTVEGFARRLGENVPVIGPVLASDRIAKEAQGAARAGYGMATGNDLQATHPFADALLGRSLLHPGGMPQAAPPGQPAAPEVAMVPGTPGTPNLPPVAPLGPTGKQETITRGGAPVAGGGGGGGDPYGISSLRMRVGGDEKAVLGTYDTQQEQVTRKGDLEAKAAQDKANIDSVMADRAQREAQVNAEENAIHYAKMEDWQAKTAEKVEALANMKADPNRVFGNADLGDRFMFTLGSALGGMAQARGLTKDNDFLANAKNLVAQDIADQEKVIDRKRGEVDQRNTLLGQFQKVHGDRMLAKTQTENAMLTSARQYMQAQADAENNPPTMRNNAAILVTQIDREQENLRREIDTRYLQIAQQQAAQAAAARIAAQRHAEELAFKTAELELKRDAAVTERMKVQGQGGEKIGEETRWFAGKMGEAKIPELRSAVTDVLSATADAPLSATQRFANTLGVNSSSPAAYQAVFGEKASQREQALSHLKNTLYNKLSGAAVGPKEEERLKHEIMGAGDLAALQTAAKNVSSAMDSQEANFQKAISPQALQAYNSRRPTPGGLQTGADVPTAQRVK